MLLKIDHVLPSGIDGDNNVVAVVSVDIRGNKYSLLNVSRPLCRSARDLPRAFSDSKNVVEEKKRVCMLWRGRVRSELAREKKNTHKIL